MCNAEILERVARVLNVVKPGDIKKSVALMRERQIAAPDHNAVVARRQWCRHLSEWIAHNGKGIALFDRLSQSRRAPHELSKR